MMRTVTAVVSRIGGRSRNEDDLRWRDDGADFAYWLLADGLGGHAAGDVAAHLAVTAAEQALGDAGLKPGAVSEVPVASAPGHAAADGILLARLERAFAHARHAIEQGKADASERAGMRATLVAALRAGDRIAWGHVGDSRLYHFSALRLQAMTRDHSVQAMIAPLPRDTRADEARNRLLRVLGEADAEAPELAAPIAVQAGDALLLCSDGWWDHVLETEMEIDLAAASSPAQWLERMEDRLLERVSGEYDNYTAIAVWCVDENFLQADARWATNE